jgi:hypothetical protein
MATLNINRAFPKSNGLVTAKADAEETSATSFEDRGESESDKTNEGMDAENSKQTQEQEE